MRASSSAARGPVVSQPERSVSVTASISSSPIAGGWKDRKVSRLAFVSVIGGGEAYALGRRVRPRDRLVARRAEGKHRARPVGAAAKRRESVAGLAVQAHTLDSFEVIRHLDRPQHP